MAKAVVNVAAEYGVPHTKFERNSSGFTVNYRRMTVPLYGLTSILGVPFGIACLVGVIGIFSIRGPEFVDFPLALSPIALGLFIRALQPKIAIAVDGEFVTIRNERMSRSDFGSFVVYGSETVGNEKSKQVFHQLGYQLGRRTLPIPGAWTDREAEEVASALNTELKRTPLSGDDAQTSPELLRAIRPNAF